MLISFFSFQVKNAVTLHQFTTTSKSTAHGINLSPDMIYMSVKSTISSSSRSTSLVSNSTHKIDIRAHADLNISEELSVSERKHSDSNERELYEDRELDDVRPSFANIGLMKDVPVSQF